ncbi:MAG: cation transporter [Deltaproteobacteria bacterium]|nr:cation transporter [Deltaproteobacteria bacterium]
MESEHHDPNPVTSWGKRLFVTMMMNLVIPLVQIVAGILAGSMALISDALHNLSDFISIVISYAALKIGQREPSLSQTFGYRRVEVVAAVFNVAILFGAAFYITVEGWVRLRNPSVIQGNLVIGAALLGIAANGISTWLLHAGAKENLNMRGAFLHMLTDTLTSVGVALLGVLWLFRPWYWLDPIVSWAIVVLILYNGWGILKESLLILMNATPPGIDLRAIQKEVEALEGIEGLHHLHVWNPSSGTIALAAHVIVPDQMLGQIDDLAKKVRDLLLSKFNIDHPILQFESGACGSKELLCALCRSNYSAQLKADENRAWPE